MPAAESSPPVPGADVPIAVVGASALFPGSVGSGAFWSNILAGRDFMTEVPPDHWLIDDYHDPDPRAPGKTYARRGAFLPAVDFDPMEYGLPPRQLATTDVAQLLALGVAQKVLADAASVQFGRVDRRDISVILGVASATELLGEMASRIQRPHWVNALRASGLPESQVQQVCDRIEASYPEWDESTFPGLLGNVVAGRIANRLNLGGTNCVIDAACASSLGAVAMAVQELQLGHSELVITGGVDALNNIFMYMCFSKTPALSPTGDCRPFAEAADGTMLGEGIGMLALRRLADAERDGDRIYAVLRGIGSSSDGRAKSIYAPVARGQEIALRRAYQRAGYTPRDVGLVEAHGTATLAGDAAEFEALRATFADGQTVARPWCALGSVKSQIGHTKAAAGSASLFKVVMALHHKVLPPTIKVDRPNPKLEIERSPFYLNTETRPWVQAPGRPRRGSVSSFGFGGSNFHVTLEEYRGHAPAAPRLSTLPSQLLVAEGADAAALIDAVRALQARLQTQPLAVVARASQPSGKPPAACRLALVAADADEARRALEQALQRLQGQGVQPGALSPRLHLGQGAQPPKIAFLFPGQGSQRLNMGRALAVEFDDARRPWDLAAALPLDPGLRLDEVVFPPPVFSDAEREAQAARLTLTEWAQPALGACSLGLLALLQRLGVRPDAVAGHSYGELVALHAAGAIATPEQLLTLSRRRGELMRDAAAVPGAMLAVQAGADAVQPLLAQVPGVVIANHNSPRQVVVAGPTAAVQAFEPVLQRAGLGHQRLPVATAFHTALVAPSAAPWRAALDGVDLAAPALPVYGNTPAEPYPADPDQVRELLAGQLAEPVHFAAMVRRMHDDGVRLFVEVGAGSALTGLVGDILAGLPHAAVATGSRTLDARDALLQALAVLAAQGVPLDFAALWADFAPPEPAPPPRTPATVQLTGTTHGKPYPSPSAMRPPPNPEPPPQPAAPPPLAGPAPAVMPATMPASAALPPAAWSAFEAMQKQAFDAHAAFTQALTASHQAYLKASEAAFLQLSAMSGVAPGALPTLSTSPMPVPPALPLPPPPAGVAPAPAAAAPPAPVFAPAPPPAAVDVQALLLQVVADKTGYPVEMLSPEMELEAGLGIDSIKRVEILSALQERLPALAGLETSRLATLNTLGEIIAVAREQGAGAVPVPVAPTVAPAAAVDAKALLLQVVADKTGYPVEMLNLDMELEAGLGIDSIKRVEILSALQEKLPGLAAVDSTRLAGLNTLGEIVAFAGQPSTPAPVAVAAPPAMAVAVASPAPLQRWCVELADAPSPGFVTPGLGGPVPLCVVGGPPAIARRLVARLAAAGIAAQERAQAPADATALLLLTGLNDTEDSPAAQAALNEALFADLQPAAAAMATGGRLLVTVQSTGGDFGIGGSAGSRAWSAGIAAAAKTAALEWPQACVRALDIDTRGLDADEVADRLADELLTGGADLETGLPADGRRVAPRLVGRDDSAPAQALDADGVLLVSGGARGVTTQCLLALLRRQPCTLALLGRTPLVDEPPELAAAQDDAALKRALLQQHAQAGRSPAPRELAAEVQALLAQRELRANLQRLRALGARVEYRAVDVGDGPALRAVVDELRAALGPIRGLVHAAGVLADREIRHKTAEQVRRVMRAKVDGLRHLLDATRDDALTHLVCFSSVAARSGNVGQLDYAMANEVLNRVCQAEARRRGATCRVKAIGWGPWAGGMVGPELARHFQAQGVGLIELDAGAELFADEFLGRRGGAVETVCGSGLPAATPTRARPGSELRLVLHHQHRLQPWLADHAPRQLPVLPLVAVLHSALQALRAWRPGAKGLHASALQVHAGVLLPQLDGAGHDSALVLRLDDAARQASVRVLSPAEVPLHSLQIRWGDDDTAPALPPVLEGLDPWLPASGRVYDGRLFHGPALQVIQALTGRSAQGCSASLRLRERGRHAAPAPVALLDGGLQLAVLWIHEQLQCVALPTAVDKAWVAERWPEAGDVRCDARLVEQQALHTRWDLAWRGPDGAALALMRGLRMHVLPEGAPAAGDAARHLSAAD